MVRHTPPFTPEAPLRHIANTNTMCKIQPIALLACESHSVGYGMQLGAGAPLAAAGSLAYPSPPSSASGLACSPVSNAEDDELSRFALDPSSIDALNAMSLQSNTTLGNSTSKLHASRRQSYTGKECRQLDLVVDTDRVEEANVLRRSRSSVCEGTSIEFFIRSSDFHTPTRK